MNDDIELQEYKTAQRPKCWLEEYTALAFIERFGDDVVLEFPTPANNHQWLFRASGKVGYFPLDATKGVRVLPKVPINNVLGMLKRVYDIKIRILDDGDSVGSLDDLFNFLAGYLAQLVMTRVKRGLAKAYQERRDDLPYVRGRIDVSAQVRRPVAVRFACDYQEHTADIHDNQVLRWTLLFLSRTMLHEPAKGQVRLAQHALASVVSAVPVRGSDAVAPYYDRLRQDYRPMHALCHLFLDTLTPTLRRGQHESVPLLIAMYALFERYVLVVLQHHFAARGLRVLGQKTVHVGHGVSFQIDIVIQDRRERTLLVLDTKYKNNHTPKSDDVQQAVAYAEALGCRQAALIYPTLNTFDKPMTLMVGQKQVHRLGLDLTGDLPSAAATLCADIEQLLKQIPTTNAQPPVATFQLEPPTRPQSDIMDI